MTINNLSFKYSTLFLLTYLIQSTSILSSGLDEISIELEDTSNHLPINISHLTHEEGIEGVIISDTVTEYYLVPIKDPIEQKELTRRNSGLATRFTDMDNTFEDNEARCAADLWAIARNFLGAFGCISQLGNLAFSTLAQTTWVSKDLAYYFVITGTVFTWLTPLFTSGAASAHVLSNKRKAQGAALAREYNRARGYDDPEPKPSETSAIGDA